MKEPSFLKKLLALIVLLDIAVFALFFWLLGQVQQVQVERADLAQNVAEQEAKEQRLLTLKKQLELIRSEREQINSYFVTTPTISLFLEVLEALGARAGVGVVINTIEPRSENGHDVLGLSLGLTGGFTDLEYYLLLLERLPFVVDARRVFFDRAASTATGKWTVNLDLAVLSFSKQPIQ